MQKSPKFLEIDLTLFNCTYVREHVIFSLIQLYDLNSRKRNYPNSEKLLCVLKFSLVIVIILWMGNSNKTKVFFFKKNSNKTKWLI